jgi:tetratricopeptide (TPR) repeat protein
MAVTPIMGTYAYHRSHTGKDTRTLAAEWIEANTESVSSVATTSLGMHLDPGKVLSLSIPFHPVYPELTTPFYDLSLYSDVDIVVVSSFDYGRFLSDSTKYRPFIEFYRLLERTGTAAAAFHPAADQDGPDIRLVRPPSAGADSIPATAITRVASLGNDQWVVDALGRLGLASFLKGRYARSAGFFTAVVSLDPVNLSGLNYLAKSLLQVDQPGEAQGIIERYLALAPGAPEMVELHAVSLLGQGKTAEAEREFLRIIAANPQNETAYAGLISLYEQLGAKEQLVGILLRYQQAVGADSERGRLLAQKIAQARGF